MHKVKGLEFDAVLIPPSFSNLPRFPEKMKAPLEDYIQEERRLYYVACSRAKRKLVVIKYERENALEEGISYRFSQNVLNNLGIAVDEVIDNLTMYCSASVFGGNSFFYIKNNVKIGDRLVLLPVIDGHNTFWYATINNNRVALLSRNMVNEINHLSEVNGFIVSSIYVSTYDETLKSDEKNNTNYASRWTEFAKSRGYVYLIDFSGYGN